MVLLNGFSDGVDNFGYVDYERYPHGFGTDGSARTERVTYVESDKVWYSSAVHNEPDGEETYLATSGFFISSSEAVAWLDADRRVSCGAVVEGLDAWTG